MSKRKIKKVIERAVHLPQGYDLVRYTSNKIRSVRLKLSNSLEVAHPSSVMIELTNLCNLKCITCAREYSYGAEMDKGMIDYELYKQIVDQLYPHTDSIGLTGLGETLLYKNLNGAVDYIQSKSKGIITFISTNAHVNDIEEKIAPLAGKIDTLQISIDGVGDVYDSIRRNGDFDFFNENINKISNIVKNTKTDLMFNAVIFEKNYHQMADLVKLASSHGIRYMYFNTMNLVSTDWDLSNYDIYNASDFRKELSRARAGAAARDIELETFDFETPAGFRKCGYPWDHFYITWDGYVVPCCAKPFPKELHFGNVKEQSLMSCLNSPAFQEFRQKWQMNSTPDFCRRCHMIDLRVQK